MRGTATSSLGLRLFGERWLIDLSAYADPAPLAEQLRALWGRVLVDDAAGPDVVFQPLPSPPDGPPPHQSPSVSRYRAQVAERADGPFPYAFSRALTQAAISHLAGSGLLLHAAGLASPDDARAVVMVAASGTGKSTAARTLGARLGYLSDELIRIDAASRVQGLTKPLSIIEDGFPGGKRESSPDELRLAPTPPRAPALAAVICLSRSVDPVPPELEPISVHELIEEVMPQSSSIWRTPGPLHALVASASRCGGPYRLRYAEIADAAGLVEGLLADASPSRAAPEWTGHLPAADERWTAEAPPAVVPDIHARTTVRRAPWTDAVEQDDEISLLIGPSFLRIVGIAASLWRFCAVPRSVAEVLSELRRRHGDHPEALALASAAIGELASRGAVLVDPDTPAA